MASTIKVDNVQNQPGTNIVSKCGTDVTLGASGDTVALASGASQSGFGRTGTVDWVTSIKVTGDSPITAVSGKGYFLNTTAGTITINLPSSPSAGDIVSIKDYARTFATNNVTVGRGGSNMDGTAADTPLATNGLSVTFIYMDATKGWSYINEDTTTQAGASYVAASGGNSTATCGDYKIHTFTGPGTFCVSCAGNAAGSNSVEYIVVAGGGSGGTENAQSVAGGGGGAGGFRYHGVSLAPLTYPGKPLSAPAGITASATAYPIVVGAGGTKLSTAPGGNDGSNSSFSTITSAGGGQGGYTGGTNPGTRNGVAGGSGGGASHGAASPYGGGQGNVPPTSPAQGNNGGGMTSPGTYLGGGGGGAIQVGVDGGNQTGPGGDGAGIPTAFGSNGVPCGSYRYYAGGGGGGGSTNRPETGPAGAGGKGGGAAGGAGQNSAPADATANSGGGGGGAGNLYPNPGSNALGSNGGSGIVIIRYKFQ